MNVEKTKMNFKITFTVLIGIFVAIILFYFIMNWYPSNFDSTYTWVEYIKNKSDKPKILLLGSSHTGVLDTDYIQKYLTDKGVEYEVYNLAQNSDYPTRRAEKIGHISELKPEMILYGIEIRMFEGQPSIKQEDLTALQITEIQSVTPNTKEVFKSILFPLTNNDFFSKIPKSPKITTLQTIKHFVRNSNQTMILDIDSNKPFFNIGKKDSQIIDLEILQNDWEKKNVQFQSIDSQNNREFDTLKKIIKELESKDIKVVIFATPKSSAYLNLLPKDDKIIFDQMLDELENSGITVYKKYDNYANYNIWSDPAHVAENKLGVIYSEDISKIIVKEITK